MAVISHLIGSISESAKNTGDSVSIGVAVVALAGWLPAIAALVSIAWGVLRIIEWFEKRKHRKFIEAVELEQIKAGKLVISEKVDD